MERLKLDFIQLNKALKALDDSFDVAQEIEKTGNKKFILAAEDSTIQRFEYCYEGFWKFLKKYLEVVSGLEGLNSPKNVFRVCVQVGVCTLDEGSLFIEMANGRNETSHTYSIEASRIILLEIEDYYQSMIAVSQRLDVRLGFLKDL